jgi:excisionase family DNA binding protein
MRRTPKDPDVMSADQVAAWLGMGRRQVYEAAARGELPHFRTGRTLRFSRTKISAFIHGPKPTEHVP